MKKIYNLFIFLLVLFPIKVNALVGSVNLNCGTTNNNIVCNITASSDEEITGFSADIKLSSNLKVLNFQADSSIWEGDASNNKIGLYTAINQKGTFNIGVLTLEINGGVSGTNETISLINCMYSDYNFNKVILSDVNENIKIQSSVNDLSNLNVSPGNINFNPDTLEYSLTVENEVNKININSVLKDNKSSYVEGYEPGDKNLNTGLNQFEIRVKAENGSIKTYKINVVRKEKISTENTLSKLTIEGYNINFDPNKGEYNLTVENNVDKINISSVLKDNKSSYVESYEPGSKNLNIGLNQLEIKVKAENGSIRTYKINITRKKEVKSNDNYLTDIETDVGDINFDKKTEEYKMTVSYDTDKIELNTKSSSNKSKVEISGNDDLKVGDNEITIKVTAEDGSVREYKIIVTRKEKDIILSNNSYLKELIIDNYDINFDKEKYKYNITIKKEKKLTIKAITDDKNANVVIKNNDNLEKNSVIEIVVTAEDSSTSIYEIKINKKEKKKIDYSIIVIIIEFIIILGFVIYSIVKKKKSDPSEEI